MPSGVTRAARVDSSTHVFIGPRSPCCSRSDIVVVLRSQDHFTRADSELEGRNPVSLAGADSPDTFTAQLNVV
jgi:hypothetical protein